jgi:hypothetical protein
VGGLKQDGEVMIVKTGKEVLFLFDLLAVSLTILNPKKHK